MLGGSPAELAPRLRTLSGRLGSDDAALLALFCGEDAARYATAEARSPALEDLYIPGVAKIEAAVHEVMSAATRRAAE